MQITLEQQTKQYADQHTELRDAVEAFNWEVEDIKNKHLSDIREKVLAVKTAQSKLEQAIKDNSAAFNKTKTLTLHGIKIGTQKQKGTINFADNSIALIKKKMPDQVDNLILTKQTISKTAASHLSVADIKKIGGEVIADKDAIIIKSMDSNVDKLVIQLLKDNSKKRCFINRTEKRVSNAIS